MSKGLEVQCRANSSWEEKETAEIPPGFSFFILPQGLVYPEDPTLFFFYQTYEINRAGTIVPFHRGEQRD